MSIMIVIIFLHFYQKLAKISAKMCGEKNKSYCGNSLILLDILVKCLQSSETIGV